jgi:hypothetical protein
LFPFVCFLVPGRLTNKGISLSFRLQRKSLDSEGVKLIEKERQYLLLFKQFRGRQDIIPLNPIAPDDMFRDIAVRHKKAYLGSLCKRQTNIQASQGTSRESKRDFRAILQS